MPDKVKQVVLTRPVAQSQELARQLAVIGYSVTLFPLFDIIPLAPGQPLQQKLHATLMDLSRYAMAVFVSPNAVHAVFQQKLLKPFQWPSKVALAVMGTVSRAALAKYGVNQDNALIYSPSDSVHFDSEALLQSLDLLKLQGRDVVIFQAETGRDFFPDALVSHGINVVKVVAYHRLVPSLTSQTREVLRALLAVSAYWVVNSSEALRIVVDMIQQLNTTVDVAWSQRVHLIVSHQRIATMAKKYGLEQVRLVDSGDQNLLLTLQSYL